MTPKLERHQLPQMADENVLSSHLDINVLRVLFFVLFPAHKYIYIYIYYTPPVYKIAFLSRWRKQNKKHLPPNPSPQIYHVLSISEAKKKEKKCEKKQQKLQQSSCTIKILRNSVLVYLFLCSYIQKNAVNFVIWVVFLQKTARDSAARFCYIIGSVVFIYIRPIVDFSPL